MQRGDHVIRRLTKEAGRVTKVLERNHIAVKWGDGKITIGKEELYERVRKR